MEKRQHNTLLIVGITAVTVLVLATIFVFAIPLPFTGKETYTEREPQDFQEAYTEQEPYTDTDCLSQPYLFSWTWPDGGGLSTNHAEDLVATMEISNQEDQSGNFVVKLAFYDNNYYPWDESTKGNQNANWNNANMYSESKSFSFGPNERRTITIATPKKNPDAAYWARGEVTPPTKLECSTSTEYRTVTKYRTATRYEDVQKERDVVRYAPLFKQWMGGEA